MKKMIKSLMAAIGVALLMTGSVFAATTVTTQVKVDAFGDNTVYDGTTYYDTLQKAVEAVCGTAGATLYCKPGADVGSLQHAPVTATLTIYGNGAYVSGGSERDFDIGNTDPSGGKDIAADMTLTVKDLDGCGAWGAKATAHTVNLVFEDCQNMGKVFITGTTGTLNITIKDSSFEGVIKEAVYSNADGAITLTNVDFSNLNKAVNLNHKAAGTQTVTITDCSFTDCGADVANDQIPVRVLSSVDGGKSVLTVSGTTFTGTPEGGADILLDYGVGETTANISTAGTAANIVVEKTNNVGTTTTIPANTHNQSFATVEPVAKIGTMTFKTFAEALTAAKAMTGDVTVEIYEKVTLNSALSGSYSSITFVGKDTDAEIYLEVQGYITATGKTVNFQDLKLSKSQGGFITNAGFMNTAFGVYDVKAVNYTNCTFSNGAYASSGTVTFTKCIFKRSWDKYGLWAYGDVNCIVDECTFDDYRGIKMYAEGAAKTTELTVKNSNFSAVTDKPAIVLTYGESVNLEGNTYSSTGTFELDLDGAPNGVAVTSDVAPICKNDNGDCGVLVDGRIYTTVAQAAEVATSGSTVTLLHDSTETVELPEGVTLNKNNYAAAGVTVAQPIAKIGETTYATLEAAFAAATEGQTITLFQDAAPALTSQRAITKAAVIDLGGKTLTLMEDDLYFGTTTFQNGTIVVDPSVKPSTAVFWMFANQTLTFDAVKIVATGVTGTYLIGLDGDNADLNLLNGSEILVENTTALDLDIVCVNASTGNDIVIDNSKINVKNLDGRVLFRGNYAIKGDSEINLEGITKAGIRIEAGQTLSIEDTASVTITGEPRDGGIHLTDATATYTKADTATVTATVNRPAIAQIGDAKYASLAAAIAAAQNGDTVVISAGEYAPINISYKNITIQGTVGDNGELLTVIKGGNPAITGHSFNGTIKDIKVVDAFKVMYAEPAGNVTVDNIYVTGATYGLHLIACAQGLNWTIKNSYMDLAWANSFGVYGGDAAIVIKGNEFVSTNPYYPDYGAIPVNTFLPNITVEENVFGENTKIKLAAAFTDTSKINVSKNYHADGVENAFADDSSVEVSIRQYYTDSELQNLVELLKGAGTEADPFVIATIEDLKFFRDEVNGGNTFDNQFVKMAADIDLNNVAWTPIGNGTTKFLGTFDGSGKTISNLVVDINANNAGLFGFASVIKNLAINNAKVEGVVCVGAMVGELESSVGTLDNCHVTGRIEVTGENSVGGLAGKGYANIRNSSVIGDGVATSFVLGIYGTTEEGDNVGGLIGHLGEGNTLGVANSTVKNIKVVGTRKIGGLVGTTARANDYVGNTVENVTVESSATAEYADNNASTCTIGGIIGNYFGSATSGGVLKDSTVKDVTFVIGNAKSAGALVGGDRVNNGGEPVGVEASGSVVQNVAGATVSYFLVAQIGDSYYATLQAALDAAAAGTGNVTVEILSDIDLTGTDWNPVTVSASGYPFVTVNGNGKTITGLNDMLFAGTWAGKSGLVINDLTIAESTIVNDENDSEGTVGVGAFIGYPQASETITLKNCHLTKSTVKGGHWTGGLIGMAGGYSGNDGPVFMTLTIEGCSVTDSTITGKGSAGGIIGHGSCSAWTDVIIVNSTVSGNTITSTGSSNNKAGSVMGTIGAAGQPTTADGVTKTGGMSVSVTTADNTVKSADKVITTIYGRQGTPTGLLEIAGGTYEAYPIEENVNYAAPKEGYIIFENADGKYGVKEGTYVAQIDGVKYETLAAAFAAAQDGDVVTFLSDVKQNDGVLITDKKLTVDLNGKTFTVSEGASTNNRNFKINGASEVVISNGTMVAEGDYGSGAYGTVRTEGTAHVALQNLELYNYRGNGLNVKACTGTSVTMTDVEIYAQYGGGVESAGGTVELTDVVVQQKGMYTAPYNSMAISVNGGGTVIVQSGTYSTECLTAEEANNQGTSHGPWVAGVLNSGGTLIINGGTFSNDNFGENSLATYARGAILADTAANIQINGGTFNALKAIVDIQNNLGNADKNPSCVLAGGTFSADPCVSANYGSNLITVKEGYLCAEQNSNPVTYKVGKLPSAEVINLGPVVVGPEGDFTFGDNYYVYDLVGTQKMTTSSDPFDLQIALNFIAKDTVAQAEKNAFGNYTTDFYITIDGIADGSSFVADEDCYLAGYYPSFNAWVKIPLTGFTIEDGKVYPVITSAGFNFKYTDICGSVGDFICGIHLSDAVLQVNPDLKVKLELGLSKTYDDALAADKFIRVDQPYEYDVEDMTSAVAVTGPDYYTTVTGAVEAALETGDYVKLVKNNAGLEDNLEINRDLVFNLGGKTLAADGKTLTITDSVVTITNGTLSAFTKDNNITLTGNAVLTVTDANVAASFRSADTYYVSQNANDTYSIMLKSAFRVFITMVDGEPRIGFFQDCAQGAAACTLLGATSLENADWTNVVYTPTDDASGASELPLFWVKLDQAADDTNVYRFFKIGPAPVNEQID